MEQGFIILFHYIISQYKKLGIEGSAPDAELAANHVISLPVHPSLTQEDLDLVIDAVKQASDSFN